MMEMRARLRPMGIGNILAETFRLYHENFMLFVATCAVIEVPFQIIIVLLTFGLVGSIQPLTAINGTTGQILTASQAAHLMQSYMQAVPTFFALLLATGLVWLVAFAIMSAALAIVICNRYLNRTASVGQTYSAGAQRIGALLLALVWIVVRFILLIIAVAILAGMAGMGAPVRGARATMGAAHLSGGRAGPPRRWDTRRPGDAVRSESSCMPHHPEARPAP
jgi:hypothetical protein